jgi:hypothetical protein
MARLAKEAGRVRRALGDAGSPLQPQNESLRASWGQDRGIVVPLALAGRQAKGCARLLDGNPPLERGLRAGEGGT